MTVVVGLLVVAALVWPLSGDRSPSAGGSVGGGPRRSWRRGRGRRQLVGDWVAELAEVVSVGLRAGLDLPGAVRVASRSPAVARTVPWLAGAADATPDTAALVDEVARLEPEAASDLVVLARAWRLSASTGAAAATTTAAAAAAVRARRAARHRTRAALAGPQASMRLLSVLPLCGPVVGVLVGLDPVALYATVPARLAALAGLALTGLGWVWAAGLLRRAARPATTGTAAGETTPSQVRVTRGPQPDAPR